MAKKLPFHIHFIGICGVAMSALAMAFHKKGCTVTGSDKGFYPPVSTYLKEAGINYYPGWHPEKMTANGDPDLVIVGNVAGSTNPEWLYVQERNVPYLSYPEALAKYFLRETSVVCSGTYGKTTTTTLMSHICRELGKDPSYMFGGLAQSGMPSAAIGDGTISIMEGDEYKSARWDMRAKFMHYSPTHLLLTAARWDHADIYPTEEDYREAFRTLVGMVPETGVIVRSADEPSIDHVIDNATCAVVTYGMTTDADITYRDVKQSTEGLSFEITIADQSYPVTSPMIGRYVAENIAGCIAMCHVLGCDIQLVIDAIKTFPGIKRRLEKRGQTAAGVPVFDDIAHSPDKARSVLKNLTEIFSGNIYCIYEPNTGNRRPQAMPLYDHAFADADAVIIGRLSRVKIDPNDPDKPVNGEELANQIKKTHERVHYIASDDKLIEFLNTNAASGDAIVFCGSHGFRGMIEQLCIKTPTS